jgi:2-amino-4-hydroxy-6-hydroxymethyldihydropteridine diphosphokinase
MADVLLGLGSNLGDKQANLRRAVECLTAPHAGASAGAPSAKPARLVAASSLYRTAPVGLLEQDWFFNAAIRVQTALTPRQFLQTALEIERRLGRVRNARNGPRLIDIDILLWDGLVVAEPGLLIPHPRLHERLFVLEPLAEIAPGLRHPLLGKTMLELRADLIAAGGVQLECGPQWAGALA